MIGVIGHGFVGSAVSSAFDDVIICDPAYNNTTIQDVLDKSPDAIFVCVPTPEGLSGEVDGSILKNVLSQIPEGVLTIVKSTITPVNLPIGKDGLVLNPEFLTQANAKIEFINPQFQLFGGKPEDTLRAEQIYKRGDCKVKLCTFIHTDIITASFVKYSINSFLATKVIFMNELKSLYLNAGGTEWDILSSVISKDDRIGKSHMMVPGPDGMDGFGGACFPKDTSAFIKFAIDNDSDLSVLDAAVRKNLCIRGWYEVDRYADNT
jgi:UDPglucose 6-dehydrogenase